jgi:hypothetical protein
MHAKTCIDCGMELTGHGSPKRCQKCAAKKRYLDSHGAPPKRIIAKCEYCGKEFSDYVSNRTKSKKGIYFCSSECRSAWVGIHNSVLHGGDGQNRSKSEKDKLYYRDNSSNIRNSRNIYYQKNRESILEKKREEGRKRKQIVIDAYGGKCECCGETTFEFLTIDHINNDGAEHRRRIGGKGTKIYKYLIEHDFPKDGYRLLCFNCNISRGFYGYCPHHPDNKAPTSHRPFNPGRKRTVA